MAATLAESFSHYH